MISFLIGIITAAIVFYMSMIYGNAALALLGCFMCVFMVLCADGGKAFSTGAYTAHGL